MTTIQEALVRGIRLLSSSAVQNARPDAQFLLCRVVGIERATLYAHPERDITPAQEQEYFALIARRQRHEPIAYIIGDQEFYGLDFMVDKRVLIPRPETELLVERALTYIQACIEKKYIPVVADIGTGSGAIPIAIAVKEPRLPYVYACDISADALEVARINSQHHGVESRIRILQGDLLAPLPEPVDLLLANLPYVGTEEIPELEADVHEYEPHLALFSGPHGLDLLRRMCKDAHQSGTLKPGGEIVLEIGYQQREALAQMFQALWPEARVSFHRDYAGFDRLVQIRG